MAMLGLLLAIPLPEPVAAGQEAAAQAPDFSAITTRTAASKLVRKHQLVKIHIVPTELGGPNTKPNIVYVTPEAAAAHALLTEMLSHYVEHDLVDRLEILPDYKGLSIIPTRIRFKARHSRGGETFERTIEIWECGLCVPFDPLPDPDRVEKKTMADTGTPAVRPARPVA
jgi:hypothetical protein